MPLNSREFEELSNTEKQEFCWIHYQVESWKDEYYRWCFECSHVYKTEQELVDLYNEGLAEVMERICDGMRENTEYRAYVTKYIEEDIEAVLKSFEPVLDGSKIYFCPLCLHDF